MISLHIVKHRSSLDSQFFAMTRSSVKNFSENYQSLYSSVTADSVIYSDLSSCILKYLRIDFVQKHRYSVSHSQTLNESLKASTLWNIKNVKQLQHWVEQDSEMFLEDLNSLWTQRDLDVKACELFDKISSEQIWKTRFEKIDRAKKRLNQLNQTLQNKLIEAQHHLQVTKDVTSSISILFTFSKRSQKLSNSSLFTNEKESIWDNYLLIKFNDLILLYWLTEKDSWQARNQRRSFQQWQSYTSLHSFLNQQRCSQSHFRQTSARFIELLFNDQWSTRWTCSAIWWFWQRDKLSKKVC